MIKGRRVTPSSYSEFITIQSDVGAEGHSIALGVGKEAAQPRCPEVSFFTVTLLFTLLGIVVIGAGIGATLQNYRIVDLHERCIPRWLPFALTGLTGIFVGAVLVALIIRGSAGASTGTSSIAGEPAVHMGPGNFVQSSVTVSKGSKLLLVDDGSFVHILRNGTWNADGTPQPTTEPGAPTVNNVQVNGNTMEIGPFTTAGVYHLYCTVHQGMNLTNIVH